MATKTSKTSATKAKRTSKLPAAQADGLLTSPLKRAPTHDEIASRAFELYQLRGSEGGALNDWLAAEQELRAS